MVWICGIGIWKLYEGICGRAPDIFLFSGTVASNIRLGRSDISDERVKWAAKEVHAQKFIERLREGYQSEVKERGAGLSVGQKQLISFARALAFDPALLILDEATSSIDTETEQWIQQAIGRVMQDRTSIVVAHRLSTIQRADQIIVMHHGEIREQGTHQELLAKHGLYWMLYKIQYGDGASPRTLLLPRRSNGATDWQIAIQRVRVVTCSTWRLAACRAVSLWLTVVGPFLFEAMPPLISDINKQSEAEPQTCLASSVSHRLTARGAAKPQYQENF